MKEHVGCRECGKHLGYADVDGFVSAICIPCYEELD